MPKTLEWRVVLTAVMASLLVSVEASADALCNGNALAGAKLRPLTAIAAAGTLRAASDMYQMVAFVEEGPAKLSEARVAGESSLSRLGEALRVLEKDAASLPDQEFARMTAKLQQMDFTATARKLQIAPTGLWDEVAKASGEGGRGWLRACIQSKQSLRSATQAFISQLSERPRPPSIWRLMTVWDLELTRQRYLTTALFE